MEDLLIEIIHNHLDDFIGSLNRYITDTITKTLENNNKVEKKRKRIAEEVEKPRKKRKRIPEKVEKPIKRIPRKVEKPYNGSINRYIVDTITKTLENNNKVNLEKVEKPRKRIPRKVEKKRKRIPRKVEKPIKKRKRIPRKVEKPIKRILRKVEKPRRKRIPRKVEKPRKRISRKRKRVFPELAKEEIKEIIMKRGNLEDFDVDRLSKKYNRSRFHIQYHEKKIKDFFYAV